MSKFTQGQLDGYRDLKVLPYFFTEQAILRMLKAKNRIVVGDGGKNVVWDLRLSAQNLTSAGKYETFTASEKGDYTQATLPWSYVFATDAVSGLEAERQGSVGDLKSGTVRKIGSQALDELKEDFAFRFNNQLIQGDGAALNGGGGVTLTGIEQFVAASPSTGIYAGVNRATVTDHQNQQFAGTSGPSSAWAQDAWWAILNMKTLCMTNGNAGKGKKCRPDMLLVTPTNYVDIKNKGYSQNTNVGASVKSIEMIEGMEMTIEEDLDASQVYMLSSETIELILPPGRGKKDMFKIHYKRNLPNHVHPDDEVLVMDFHGQLKCNLPKANGVITSAA